MKIIRIFLILTLLVSKNLMAQTDRTPVYVHGYGGAGNSSFWYAWQNTLDGKFFLNQGTNYAYNANAGVIAMANAVSNNLPSYNRTIYIGYDMGGVVARQLDAGNPGAIGGYITVCSPLNGARIYNNLANGQVKNFVNDGYDRIKRGPSQMNSSGAYTSGAWAVVNDIDVFLKQYSSYQNNGYQNQAEIDLQEGSSYLANYTSNYANKPIVYMYGDENSPVVWRTSAAAMGRPDNANVSLARDAGAYYQGKKDLYNTLGWANILWGGGYFLYVASLYGDGADWLNGGAETGWNNLIGASTPSYQTITYTSFNYNLFSQCMYNSGGYGSGNVYNRYAYCQQQATTTSTYYYYSPVNGRSDGIIKAPSQTGFAANWSNRAVPVPMPKTNHFEISSGAGTFYETLRKVFKRTEEAANVDSFFYTEEH